jgi:hypothetical protein
LPAALGLTAAYARHIKDSVTAYPPKPGQAVTDKVCAVDEVWSALRLVIRRELRPAAT